MLVMGIKREQSNNWIQQKRILENAITTDLIIIKLSELKDFQQQSFVVRRIHSCNLSFVMGNLHV